jgi:hypothetical protein
VLAGRVSQKQWWNEEKMMLGVELMKKRRV